MRIESPRTLWPGAVASHSCNPYELRYPRLSSSPFLRALRYPSECRLIERPPQQKMHTTAVFDLGGELSLHAMLEPERPSAGEVGKLFVRLVSGHGQKFTRLLARINLIDGTATDWQPMHRIADGEGQAEQESCFFLDVVFQSGVNRIELQDPDSNSVNIDWTLVVTGADEGDKTHWVENSNAFTWYERLVRRDPDRAREPIDELIQKHGTANIRDESGQSILSVACRWRDVPLVRDLLSQHADPGGGGVFPPITCSLGNNELIRLLIDSGCDVNAADSSGKTALMDAVHYAVLESIQALLAAGADPAATDNAGRAAADYIRKKNGDANPRILQLLHAASRG